MDDISAMSFETALKELEALVQKLDSGDVPLEQSVELYERGARLRAHCQEKLKAAELKIREITQTENGNLSVQTADNLD